MSFKLWQARNFVQVPDLEIIKLGIGGSASSGPGAQFKRGLGLPTSIFYQGDRDIIEIDCQHGIPKYKCEGYWQGR